MTLDAESLTKAQRTAVAWLWRHDGRVHRPGITGEALTMIGTRMGRYHSSYVWRNTIRALITRGWLVMDGPDHWRLADGVGAALDAAESLEAVGGGAAR